MANTNEKRPILMYGATWCRDCRRVKQFFDTRGIDYHWIDLEKVPQAVEVVLKHNNGMQSIPTILFPDGTVLVEPSNQELAVKVEELCNRKV
jgi:mycoredoxin